MQVRIELSTENLARCLSAAHADLPAGQDLAHELIALVDTLRDVREAFNLRLPFADLRRSTVEANRPSAAGFIGRFFEAPLQARIDGLLRAVEDMKLLACLARHRRPGSPAPLFDPHSYACLLRFPTCTEARALAFYFDPAPARSFTVYAFGTAQGVSARLSEIMRNDAWADVSPAYGRWLASQKWN